MTGPSPAATGIDFEPGRLRAYLGETLPALTGPMRVERIGGGQSNPTYFLCFDERDVVLRKRPNGDLLPSAHDVGREFRILSALHGTAVPVPEPLLNCQDDTVIGTAFYVMERLAGRIFHGAALTEVAIADRPAIYRAHARALAALHAVDWRAVGLDSLARPGSYLDRQIGRWTRVWGDDRAGDITRLAGWLRANRPEDEHSVLVHGDFKFNNVVFHPDEPRLTGVLDWELSAIGDPLADLGHTWSAMWATRPEEYGGVLGVDLAEQGLPSAEEYLADYYGASIWDGRMTSFHQVLALLRNAGIFRGIGERAAAGTAAAADAAQQGRLAGVYLDRALDLMATG